MHNFVYLAQRRSQQFLCEPNFGGGGASPPFPLAAPLGRRNHVLGGVAYWRRLAITMNRYLQWRWCTRLHANYFDRRIHLSQNCRCRNTNGSSTQPTRLTGSRTWLYVLLLFFFEKKVFLNYFQWFLSDQLSQRLPDRSLQNFQFWQNFGCGRTTWTYFFSIPKRDLPWQSIFCRLTPHLFSSHYISETAWDRHAVGLEGE